MLQSPINLILQYLFPNSTNFGTLSTSDIITDQNQIIFPVVPNLLCFEKKCFHYRVHNSFVFCWVFMEFLLFSSTFSTSSNEKSMLCFSLIIGKDLWHFKNFFKSEFWKRKTKFIWTTAMLYDNNNCFNSFYIFLWRKYQAKT